MSRAPRTAGFGSSGLVCLGLLANVQGLASCQFDPSTATSEILDSGISMVPDADLDRPDAIAPEDCPEDIHLVLSVNGVSEAPEPGLPYVRVLLGDTVELSAAGSCTRTGTIEYSWSIAPAPTLIEDTAMPGLDSQSISVYPTVKQQYIVTLDIGDGSAADPETSVFFGFAATGFEELDFVPGDKIRDLHAGTDYLWIGADGGAFRADLAAPTSGNYAAVNDTYGGSSMPNAQVHAVYEEPSGRVWFGTNSNEGKVYQIDLNDSSPDLTAIDTIASAKSRDITGTPGTLRIATDVGVALSTDFSSFTTERVGDTRAVINGDKGPWAGGDALYPLPSGTAIDVFGGGDDKIRGLADDGTNIWVASDDYGVARLENGQVQGLYTVDNSGLSSNKVRMMTVDSIGDLWAATEFGVSRFKKDRQVWVPLTESPGLPGDKKLRAITVDESSGRRAIYAGGAQGLAVMRLPAP